MKDEETGRPVQFYPAPGCYRSFSCHTGGSDPQLDALMIALEVIEDLDVHRRAMLRAYLESLCESLCG